MHSFFKLTNNNSIDYIVCDTDLNTIAEAYASEDDISFLESVCWVIGNLAYPFQENQIALCEHGEY
jgi:hypothetical protein